MRKSANSREEGALRKQLAGGGSPVCPRCTTLLQVTSVPPRSDVSYVRSRVVLTCESCGLKAALDRK